MSNELKVNAKTDILEFKRKHNKLVDSVKNNCSKSEIPGFQGTTVIARNALTNVNGWELTSFKVIDGSYGSYTIKTITENDDTATILTEERAKVYLKAMTGSEFLPKYDYNLPQNSYLIFSDGTIWKPQFDATHGLRLFKMFEMPTSPKLYKHIVQLNLKSANLSITVYFNFLSDNGNFITGSLDESTKYFIIDFNTLKIIGFIGGSSSISIPIGTYGSNLIISNLTPWGGTKLAFNSEKITTYTGASYFGSESFTEVSLEDNVVEF